MTKKEKNTIREFVEFFEALKPKNQNQALVSLFVNINDGAIIDACNQIELLSNAELKMKNQFRFAKRD